MSSLKRQTKYFGDSEARVWPADHPRTVKPHAKKDTRRWCRGKPGAEHVLTIGKNHAARVCHEAADWQQMLFPGQKWRCYHIELCAECGRFMKAWPWRQCPDRPAKTQQ
jgi:hypothetical protein